MSSPRTRSSMAMPKRAPHSLLYPVTTSLGINGTKVEKRREVNARFRAQLALHSPLPPPSAILPTNHQGHNLTGALLNTTFNPGGYRQVCTGCSQPPCPPANLKDRQKGTRHKPKVFFIARALPPHILNAGILGRLARARAELRPVPRHSTPAAGTSGVPTSPPSSTPPSGVPISLPSSSPPSTRATTPSDTADTLAQLATPLLDFSHLRFPFGGYGGVHYSPDGHIIHPAAFDAASRPLSPMPDLDDEADLPALEYPPAEDASSESGDSVVIVDPIPAAVVTQQDKDLRAFDIELSVAIFAWFDSEAEPIRIWAYPRALGNAACGLITQGELVLADYRAALIAAGYPAEARIERYLEGAGRWQGNDWENIKILVLSSFNRYIYIRNPGVTVVAPGHVLDLYY